MRWTRVLRATVPVLGFVLCLLLIIGRADRRALSHLAFIDRSGEVKIRLGPSQRAGSFSEGLAPVSRDGSWGFIDRRGTFVIAPQFASAEPFSEGLALVSMWAERDWNKTAARKLFGYIDRSGRQVIPLRFNWASSFSDGLAAVCEGSCRDEEFKAGYIGRDGKYVLRPRYGFGSPFSEGLAEVCIGPQRLGPHGYMDKSGGLVIAPRFHWARRFSNGLAATNFGYIHRDGVLAIPAQPASHDGEFSDGWAAVSEGTATVFIDTTGKVTLLASPWVGSFSEGLAPACRGCGPSTGGHNWGYIDKTGEFVIEPQFCSQAGPFREGLALVRFGCGG